MPLHTVPLDRLHSEVAHLQREGYRIVSVVADPHKDQWHIVTEAPGTRIETRRSTIYAGRAEATLIRGED